MSTIDILIREMFNNTKMTVRDLVEDLIHLYYCVAGWEDPIHLCSTHVAK